MQVAVEFILLMYINLLLARRSLQANHQQKVEEAVEQAKTLRKAVRDGHMATEVRHTDMSFCYILENVSTVPVASYPRQSAMQNNNASQV